MRESADFTLLIIGNPGALVTFFNYIPGLLFPKKIMQSQCSSLAQPSNYRIMVRRGIEPTTFGMASVAFVIDHNCSGLAFSTGIPATP